MITRPGRSRVELVVVLSIAVLVGGLLLAAVGRARDAANCMTCKNNMKQLGLAVHNYYDSTDALPALTDQGDGAPTGQGLPSVFANLIPFIEATQVYFRPGRSPDYYHAHSSVTFTYPAKEKLFTQVGGLANDINRMFLDPADATADRLRDVPMTLPDGTTGYYATGSYAANGLLPWGARSRQRDFFGGLAGAILFAERPQVCRAASGEEVYNLWGLGVYGPHMPAFAALTPADPPGLAATGQVAPAEPFPDEGAADRDARIRVRVGRRGAAPEPPDFGSPVQILRAGRPCDPRLPASPHRSGLQVVRADGSVGQFGPDTSPWVFWAACLPCRPEDGELGGR